jgi:DNA-binding response OmpR family regulator
MTGERILVVDDEPNIIRLARMYLKREGYQVESAEDGLQALREVERLQPALVVLDIMLPELDGFEVCKRIRAQQNPIPILMLTARDDDIDKILGLELGADDYLTKPFNPRELVARVKAILRRATPSFPGSESPIHIQDMMIDPVSYEVKVKGLPIPLRAKEFDLLLTFAEHKNQVLSRDQLLSRVWGYDFYGQTRTVDVHVAHLRKKLRDSGVRIETVIGKGYKLVA